MIGNYCPRYSISAQYEVMEEIECIFLRWIDQWFGLDPFGEIFYCYDQVFKFVA